MWADWIRNFNGSWDESGRDLHGCMGELNKLKKRHRTLKILLSVGGWENRIDFTQGVNTPAKREEFARSSVTMVQDLGFDGIDIDWEYPEDEKRVNDLIALLQSCRSALDASSAQYQSNYHFLLTIAVTADPAKYRHLLSGNFSSYVDYINLIAYDYAGSAFSEFTAYQSNLYTSLDNPLETPFSTHKAIRDYTSSGIDSYKIVLGMPLQGRGFANTGGLGQRFVPQVTGEFPTEPGVWGYKVLPQWGATSHYDPNVVAAYTYDLSARTLITYDSPEVVKAKTKYITDYQLGGAIFWESSGDKGGNESLIATAYTGLASAGFESSKNCLRYPASRFENLRKGTL
ncbi:MAG: hypothetical protein Q9188_002549 [Gyalolechia gomerana]